MWEEGLIHTTMVDAMLGSVDVMWKYVGFELVKVLYWLLGVEELRALLFRFVRSVF